jgi:hypothetical protein
VQSAQGQVRGVVIRWIPGTRQFNDLSPGARAALARSVAPYKAAAIYSGNYDLHMGNFVYDRVGRVWHIDYGLACLKTRRSPEELDWIRQFMDLPPAAHKTHTADLDFALLMRDAYRNGRLVKEEVVELDRLLRGQDMREVAARIRRVNEGQIDAWLEGVVKRDTEADLAAEIADIKQGLEARRRNLEWLLEPWPGAMPGQPPGQPPTMLDILGQAWTSVGRAWQSLVAGRSIVLPPRAVPAGGQAW